AGIDCAVELTAIKKNLLNAAHIDDVGYPDGGFVQGSATECELPATDNLVAGGDTTLGDVKYSTTRNRIACSKTRSVGVTDCGSKVNDRIDDSHGALLLLVPRDCWAGVAETRDGSYHSLHMVGGDMTCTLELTRRVRMARTPQEVLVVEAKP